MGHILKVQPVLKEKIWGGTKLRDVYGYDIPSDHTGEAWVISGHKSGDCPIVEGEFKGKTVSWMFENHRELFGNVEGDQFPLLVKILDAKQDLSVQVHRLPREKTMCLFPCLAGTSSEREENSEAA